MIIYYYFYPEKAWHSWKILIFTMILGAINFYFIPKNSSNFRDQESSEKNSTRTRN